MYLCFSVHKLVKFLSNTGKVHFEFLVHLLRYIRYNNNLGLIYYDNIEDVPLSDILIQSIINNENQLMVFSDSSWQGCQDTGRSTGSYIVFYQVGPIDHCTHVPGPFSQSSTESEYSATCTSGMALSHFRMLNNELLNKDPDVVP